MLSELVEESEIFGNFRIQYRPGRSGVELGENRRLPVSKFSKMAETDRDCVTHPLESHEKMEKNGEPGHLNPFRRKSCVMN